MDSYAAYLAMTGGNTARLVEAAGAAHTTQHLAALRAAGRRDGQARRWTWWKRPGVAVRPAAA